MLTASELKKTYEEQASKVGKIGNWGFLTSWQTEEIVDMDSLK